jgi:hypothetical protein
MMGTPILRERGSHAVALLAKQRRNQAKQKRDDDNEKDSVLWISRPLIAHGTHGKQP